MRPPLTACLSRLREDLVIDIRHVAHVRHGVPGPLQPAAHDIKRECGAQVASMWDSLNRGATDVHAHPAGMQGRKWADPVFCRVVQVQCHGSKRIGPV